MSNGGNDRPSLSPPLDGCQPHDPVAADWQGRSLSRLVSTIDRMVSNLSSKAFRDHPLIRAFSPRQASARCGRSPTVVVLAPTPVIQIDRSDQRLTR